MNHFGFFQNICGFDIPTTQNTKVVEFCREMNLIPKETTCQKCLSPMRLGESTTSADQVVWQCPGYIKSDKKRPDGAIIWSLSENTLFLQDQNCQL